MNRQSRNPLTLSVSQKAYTRNAPRKSAARIATCGNRLDRVTAPTSAATNAPTFRIVDLLSRPDCSKAQEAACLSG